MLNVFAQSFYQQMPSDFCNNSSNSTPTIINGVTNSTNGWVHTPKGHLHILVIFISDLNQEPLPAWGGLPYLPSAIGHWSPSLIPNWAMASSNSLLDETPATIGNNKNLSLFYREMSRGQFTLTGDVFPELIPTTTGLTLDAINYINANYPNFN